MLPDAIRLQGIGFYRLQYVDLGLCVALTIKHVQNDLQIVDK